ncbi:hypothetical protein PYH37_001109 [Sinorhizobium numidicum]|uniref:Uncharacterized protein n=1 Tax=Sinorhizobium numidicum TaxID=680248 RepID=A0ABY8CM58_9HYPH|nr:hypothetical protein [Sinorhizobium numidicum]WEX73771.1 hypothetical protein PYH37_001109 [Sinorhizobium numidicum]WEX79756.1 hypothetical protein PYH38_001110 [Sinorhizobium numidicum]
MLVSPSPRSNDLETIARSGGRLRRMMARVPTYWADVRENPAWLPMFLLARTMPFRGAHWLTAKQVSLPQNTTPSMFEGLQAETVVEALRMDGLFSGLVLPSEIQEGIALFANETPCFANFDRRLEFRAADHAAAETRFGRAILSGHHFDRVLSCDAAMAVQRDPLLLDVAKRYLGGQAQLITTRIWWTFPTKSASDADISLASFKYHFDLDDWRMLKFFFYLCDVDENAGPHVYVRGSHRRRSLKHQLTLLVGHPASEVLGFYGEDKAITLTGKAGLGFVEDPFGFHMGTVAKETPRLMMEVGFGVSKPSRRRFHGEPVVR